MKNFLMVTAALAVCVGLTACNSADGGVTGIQSITSPEVTQQTVFQTAAVGTENTVQTEENLQTAEKPVHSEKTVQTDDEPSEEVTTGLCKYPLLEDMYDPCGEVTLPDVIDGCEHSSTVERMFYNELPIYEYSEYEAGESDYDECNECYKRLLAEHIINHCDRAELFGGAYFCDGWLQVKVTDYGSRDEILGDFLDGLESVNVSSCNYSYCYLAEVQGIVRQAQVGTTESQAQAGTSEINVQNNCVDVTVSSELEAEIVREAVENAGLDLDAVHIEIENEWEIVSEPRYTEP